VHATMYQFDFGFYLKVDWNSDDFAFEFECAPLTFLDGSLILKASDSRPTTLGGPYIRYSSSSNNGVPLISIPPSHPLFQLSALHVCKNPGPAGHATRGAQHAMRAWTWLQTGHGYSTKPTGPMVLHGTDGL
jgi:hypothetical protein